MSLKDDNWIPLTPLDFCGFLFVCLCNVQQSQVINIHVTGKLLKLLEHMLGTTVYTMFSFINVVAHNVIITVIILGVDRKVHKHIFTQGAVNCKLTRVMRLYTHTHSLPCQKGELELTVVPISNYNQGCFSFLDSLFRVTAPHGDANGITADSSGTLCIYSFDGDVCKL